MKYCWSQISIQAITTLLGVHSPASVDAVSIDTDVSKIYVIKDDVLYIYDASCTPTCTFTFDKCLDFTANDPDHPFYAAPTSPVVAPPAGIHALVVLADVVLAYVGGDLYHYDRNSEDWSLTGQFHCIT